jgi:hypothetical protein
MMTISSDGRCGRHSQQQPATAPRHNIAARRPLLQLLCHLRSLLLVIIAVVSAPAVIAETDDLSRGYEIELLIFRNLVEADGGEVWPVDYSDWFEEESLDNMDNGEQPDPPSRAAVTWLPKSQFRLTAQRNALARSAPYRPIAHFAWRQAVTDRRRAKPLEVPGGNRNPERAYVDGLARVSVERYLHLDLNLRLHLPATTTEAAALEYGVPEIRLRQKRRMRSNELHYFDHPRFGVIALITPYEPVEVAPEIEAAPETDIPADIPAPAQP